jgi:hypothetical protein
MKRVLESLLPPGSAWSPLLNAGFDLLLEGLGDGLELIRAFLGSLSDVRRPLSTFILDDLEREYGVVSDSGLTDSERRTYLDSVKHTAIGIGGPSDVQTRLQNAGFTDVCVYQNDPAIDPSSFPGAGIEIVASGDIGAHPYTYLEPPVEDYWPFIFLVGGARTGAEDFIDWNMEHSGTFYWTAGNGAVLSKTSDVKQSGLRSLVVEASGATISDQKMTFDSSDHELFSFYRLTEVTETRGIRVNGESAMNMLQDGMMNQTGTAAWTAVTATITKSSSSPYSGRFKLNIRGVAGVGWATQTRILNGRDYTIQGWARSNDGTTSPRIADAAGNLWTGTTSTSWQYFNVSWTATATGAIQLGMDTASGDVDFDDVRLIDDNVTILGGQTTNINNVFTPLIDGLEFDPSVSPGYVEFEDDIVLNGDFASATGWTTGTNWSIAAGVASYNDGVGGGSGPLRQLGSATYHGVVLPGQLYRVTYTLSNVTGGSTITPSVGGTAGTTKNGNGTFSETIRAGISDSLVFTANSGAGASTVDIDDVFLELIDESLWHENLTIEAVVKININDATRRGVFSNGNSSTEGNEQNIYLQNGRLYFSCRIAGTSRGVNTSVLTTGKYYHVVAVRSYNGTDTGLDLYVDGSSDGSGSWAGAPDVTVWTTNWLGRLRTAGGYFDGVLADHAAYYASDKSSSWVSTRYTEFIAALLGGPYASQGISPPITGSRTLTAAAWALSAASGDSLPIIIVRNSSGSWEVAFVGDSYGGSPATIQAVSYSLTDGIDSVRLYCKNAVNGECAYDDVTVADIAIARVNINADLEDKFKRLILGSKPVHSWAGLLVDFV